MFPKIFTNINRELVKLKYIYKQLLLALLAGSGFLINGLQTGWISPMKEILQSSSSPIGNPLTNDEITWVASVMTLTAIFAAPIHIYLLDACGRKADLIIIFVSQTLSWIMLLIPSHFAVIIVSRICAGMAAAGVFITIWIYVKETCQDNIRGTLVVLCTSLHFFGILGIYIMGNYLNYFTILYICLSLSVVIMILIICVTPETPPFLLKKKKLQEATKILASLRGLDVNDGAVLHEINYLESQNIPNKTFENLTFKKILKNKAWRREFIICTIIYWGTGVNGTYCIVTYAHTIIAQWDVSFEAKMQTLSVPILMVLGCIVPLTCVERMGRKLLLAGNLLLSSVSLAILATSFLLKEYGIIIPWAVPIVAMSTTVSAYAMGVMTMPGVIMNDMLRFEVRAKVAGSVSSQIWLAVSLQIASYDFMSTTIGNSGLFYIFAALNLVSAIFTAVFVPETKGKSTDQIEDIMLGKKTVHDQINQ